MAFSEKARAYAFEKLEQRRTASKDREASRRNMLYARFPELSEFDRSISSLGISLAKASLAGSTNIEAIKTEMNELTEKRARFIELHRESDPDNEPCCSCGDTGYRADSSLCDCARKLMREYSLAEISRVSPLALSSFGGFSLDFYSNNPEDGYNGQSPRENMKQVLKTCTSFSKAFPTNENLLMMGDAGLGKTHLALAIANEVLRRGFEVVYCSAANIFKAIETEYYEEGRATDTIDSLKRCDLLVLDDLGAEYVNAFTASAIYDIVNTRIIAKRATVYTTNITKADTLETRYGEKVSSRLTGCCKLLSFFGDDIRLLRK